MLRVALTGGIACGKSTVARELERLGVTVVDADHLSRTIVLPGSPALAAIEARFGPTVLDDGGLLDREALGQIVFDNPAARAALEAVTHPAIMAAADERFRRFETQGATMAVLEAALIFEAGFEDGFDVVVVVAASEKTQLERLGKRDGLDAAAAHARLEAQMPLADKLAKADEVLWNDGDQSVLRRRVVELHATLMGRVESRGDHG